MGEKVTLEVFYSDTCPNCPPQKDLVKEFEDEEGVKVRMTNVARQNGRAQEHGIRAVPTTVVDGPAMGQKAGFTGVTRREKIETAIAVAKGEEDVDELQSETLMDKLRGLL
ncbi:MAG: thioredoxin family protein [Candidatus Nanohaloarchaea archaeon]